MKRREELSQLRSLDAAEIRDNVRTAEEELMRLRFRQAAGQLEHTAQFTLIKRRVARMNTVLGEKSRESAESAEG